MWLSTFILLLTTLNNKSEYRPRILTKREHDLLNIPKLLDADIYKEKSRREIRSRIRKKVRDALQELTDILESKGFEEDDANRNLVFKYENLRAFLQAIFKIKDIDKDENGRLKEDSQERLLTLAQEIILIIGHSEFSRNLTGDLYALLREATSEEETMLGIRAIYLARKWRTVEKSTPDMKRKKN